MLLATSSGHLRRLDTEKKKGLEVVMTWHDLGLPTPRETMAL